LSRGRFAGREPLVSRVYFSSSPAARDFLVRLSRRIAATRWRLEIESTPFRSVGYLVSARRRAAARITLSARHRIRCAFLLPGAEFGCSLLAYDELLPDGGMQVRHVLLLHLLLYALVWRAEAGHLASESSPGTFRPTARQELAGGFFIFRDFESTNRRKCNG